MWVITVYSKQNNTMFEFDTEEEARADFEKIKGYKVLTEVVYYNDPCFALAGDQDLYRVG